MGAAQHELAVVEGLPGHQRKGLGAHFEHLVTFELGGGNEFLGTGNLVVFSGVFT